MTRCGHLDQITLDLVWTSWGVARPMPPHEDSSP